MRKEKLFNLLTVFFFAFLCLGIYFVNFNSGTWLTGWDNLHPEFNLGLNIKRSIFGVWQEYQGLGLLAGMGHASDFIREIFLVICNLFLPLSFLRWFYTFLMLFLGPLGVYFLVKLLLTNPPFQRSRIYAGQTGFLELIAFLGALFYLLNLATVQIFYTPFEPFVTHFGFLPWMILVFIRFLHKPDKRNLIWFIVVNLLALPQAYVPTMFFVYLLILFLFFLGLLLTLDNKKYLITKFTQGLLYIFIINAFWLLPFLYFTATNIQNPLQSHNNFMSTEVMYLKNKKFGDLANTAILRNFWFDYIELLDNKHQYLVGGWRVHLANPLVLTLGYGFFGLVVLGFIYAIIKKPRYWLSFCLLFIFSISLLANDTLPFSIFDNLWRQIPVLSQVFRSPFTKFGNLAIFSYSLFFSLSLYWFLNLISKFNKTIRNIASGSIILLTASALIIYVLPIFKGNLIDNNLKLKIPAEYFQVFDYLKSQDKNSRIANLPQPSFWGWSYYLWGYHGSGFLWYGIKQPILDRAFDVWSKEDENFYWEVSQAIYSQNLDLLESILEKYQINWLVLDKNITIGGDYKALYFPQTEKLFSLSNKISLVKQFGNIKVYQVNLQTPVKDFIFLASNLPQINPYNWNNEDTGFLENGHYITDERQARFSEPDVFYPFRSLFTGRKQEELEFRVEDYNDHFIFSNNIPFKPLNLKLFKPLLSDSESKHWTKDLKEEPIATPSVELKDNKVEVKVDKKKGYFSYDSQDDENFFQLESYSCNPFNTGKMDRKMIKENNQQWLRFTSVGSSNCLSVNLLHLIQKKGYLVEVKARHLHGKSLLFKIINETSKNTIIETELPEKGKDANYFIVPPMEKYGTGYSLHFDNISIGRQKTINDLARVEVYPIPYRFLKQIKIDSVTSEVISSRNLGIGKFQVSHPNPSFYQIQLKPSAISHQPSAIILSQSFHPGWIAFTLEKKSLNFKPLNFLNLPKINILGDHIMVNNWSNGWRLGLKDISGVGKSGITIYLFFLPQLLEYLGFLLLLLFLSYSYLQIH